MPYPSLDEQIREFGVVQFCGWYFIPCPRVQSKDDYNHDLEVIHHFIKEQEYYRYPGTIQRTTKANSNASQLTQ